MTPYYADDQVTLFHGDCREVTAWLDADVLVTDPPYGMGYVAWGRNTAPIVGDPMPRDTSSTRTMPADSTALRDHILDLWGPKPAAVFGSWRALRPARTQMRLIWDKVHMTAGGVGVFKHTDEEIYLMAWPNPRGLAGEHGTVLRFPRLIGASRPAHPTPKPVPLMRLLLGASPPGIVADPFAGSGTTLVAAKALGRRCIGIEIDERYCELAAKRLAQDVLDFGEPA